MTAQRTPRLPPQGGGGASLVPSTGECREEAKKGEPKPPYLNGYHATPAVSA